MYNAEILADSLSPQGHRLTTMKITFPRFILAEAKTHRIISGLGEQVEITQSLGLNDEFDFSRNSASSRAIPFKKMVQMVQENPFIPIAWQQDHKGMQGTEYITGSDEIREREQLWLAARDRAIELATQLYSTDVTKQLCNRLLEPFMWHTVIVTATEWENFFKLRCPQYEEITHQGKIYYRSKKDLLDDWNEYEEPKIEWFKINKSQADIHIQAIAELMWDAMNESEPKKLKAGEWHIPFGDNIEEKLLDMKHWVGDNTINKVKIATARCARISYETLGDNPKIDYEADIKLHDRLIKEGHMSPFEHCARVMSSSEYNENYTHSNNTYTKGWCRNFRGFIQYRHIVEIK